MMAISPAIGRKHIWESICKPFILCVDAVADCRTIFLRVDEDPCNCARGYIHYVIDWATSLRESREITGEETESLLLGDLGRRDTRIQPQQVCDRSLVRGT